VPEARAEHGRPRPTPALGDLSLKNKAPGRFGFALPVRNPPTTDLNALPSRWEDVNCSRGQRELPRTVKMKTSGEGTLASGQGSVPPAHQQTGILSRSWLARRNQHARAQATQTHPSLRVSASFHEIAGVSPYAFTRVFSSPLPSIPAVPGCPPGSRLQLRISSSPSASRLPGAQQHSPLRAGPRLLRRCAKSPFAFRAARLFPS